MEIGELSGTDLGTEKVSYDERDAILYALCVGAGDEDLDLVYERDLRVLPSFAITLGLWTIDAVVDLGVYDPLRSLHASQAFTLRGPLPRSATLEVAGRVGDVWDKGSAAIIDVVAECDLFIATYSIYLRGLGGWGGERGPSFRPDTPVDEPILIEQTTAPFQAALYRLTGDDHPVHIDPDVALANGFERPILHGLCTLGFAARHVARALGRHPTELRAISARLSAPAYPGDTFSTRSWKTGDASALFETSVGDTTVLSTGTAAFATADA